MPQNLEQLRKKAFELLNNEANIPESKVWESFEALLEEFNIHKIELELQQDELLSANFKLAKLNQKLDDLFEYAPVAYFILDWQGDIEQLNLAASQMLDLSKSKVLHTPFTKYIHPSSQDSFYFYWQSLIQSKKAKSLQIRIKTPEDKPRYYLLNSIAYQEIHGGPMFIRISATEISAVKEAEKLRMSEKRYRLLFKNMVNGLLVLKTEYKNNQLHRFVFFNANPAFEVITGLDKKSHEGKDFEEIFPDHHTQLTSLLVSTITRKSNQKIENYPLKKDLFVNIYSFIADQDYIALIFEDISSQHLAFESLARTKLLYENVVNTQKEFIGRIAPDSTFIFLNKAFSDFLGKSEKELIGKKLLHLIPSDMSLIIQENLDITLKDKQATKFQLHFTQQKPHEKEKYIEWTCYPVYDKSFEDLELQLVGQDITDQRKMEIELQNSEQKLNTIFKILPVGVTFTDENGNIIDCNKASEDLLGIKKEEHLVRNFASKEWTIIRPDFSPMPPEEYASVRALKENSIIENVEMGIIKDQQEITWINVSAAPIPLPRLGVTIVYTDITDRFQAQEESEEKFKNLVQNSTDGIVIVNPEGNIIEWNIGCEQLFGISREEAIGQKIWAFIAANVTQRSPFYDRSDFIKEDLLNAIKTGESKWFNRINETEIQNSKNDIKTIQSVIFPVKTNYGYLLGIIARDITQAKEAEKMLKEAKQKAEEASHSKSEFLANISHEIRTPLNAILGFAEILKDFPVSDERFKNHLSGIEKSGIALMGLINDILDLSRLEAGKMSISPSPINIRSLIHDVKKLFSLKAAHKEIRLEDRVEDSVPEMILMDGTRLRQILFNLVGNAVKFTDKGRIYIHATGTISNHPPKTIDLILSVIDTGIGINPDNLETIFEPFFQKSPDGKQEGTGLGLSISRRLVEMMHGTIEVSSTVGSGTHFTVHIPEVETTAEGGILGHKKTKRTQTSRVKQSENLYYSEENLAQLLQEEISEKLSSKDNTKTILNEYIWREYDRISDILGFEEVEGFASSIAQLAEKHQLQHLKAFAQKLRKEARAFNVIEINNLLKTLSKLRKS